MSYSFSDFQVGDFASFEKAFTPEDFSGFSALSGDKNPLHRDSAYSRQSQFQKAIVPLHMTLAPLSFIAGMIFPGEPSLYLGHQVKASKPVFYGEKIKYTVRISAIQSEKRLLELRVFGLRGTDAVLEADMLVQCLQETWSTPPAIRIKRPEKPGKALITGASGELGRALAFSLAKLGWNLVLQDRGNEVTRQQIAANLAPLGTNIAFISADLAQEHSRSQFIDHLRALEDIQLVVHNASPGVESSMDELMSVNFKALKEISAALTPLMLERQGGTLSLIGSAAVFNHQAGWENYSAAKAAATNFVSAWHRGFSKYGLSGKILIPGFVATRMSQDYRGSTPALLAEEAADAFVQLLEASAKQSLWIEVGRKQFGEWGFYADRPLPVEAKEEHSPAREAPLDKPGAVEQLLRQVLKLPPDRSLEGGGLGITPGWDSLAQLQIILGLESKLGINVSSAEMTNLTSTKSLIDLCRQKADERA